MDEKYLFEQIGRLYTNNIKMNEGLQLQQKMIKDLEMKNKDLEEKLSGQDKT